MEEQEILYDYFLNLYIKSREEAIELLNKRDFNRLNNNYIHWFDKTLIQYDIINRTIPELILELQNLQNNLQPNQSDHRIEGDYDGHCREDSIYATSNFYKIVDISKCENFAKQSTKSAMWKIKYQPNGKDAKSYLKIIENKK